MANPASIADIEARWRPLTDAETPIAETRLEDAWRKLKRLLPSLETRMDADEELGAEVVRVLSDAVIRVLRNLALGGYKRRTVAVDDGSSTVESDEYDRSTLYFTDEELADLNETGRRPRVRAFSVMPS